MHERRVRGGDSSGHVSLWELNGTPCSQGSTTAGHSNRIFSMKFHPTDENVIISGGWDNTIQIWDLRVKHSVRGIYGPHIAGDALDIQGDEILTGSWRPDSPLELWDYASGKRKCVVPWNQSAIRTEPCFLYAAQFSKVGYYFLSTASSSSSSSSIVFKRLSHCCRWKWRE